MLFLTLLLSGGNLLFPREIILTAILFFYFIYFKGSISLKYQFLPLILFLVLLFVISVFHPFGFDIISLIKRYSNFIIALLILNIYLKSSFSVFRLDLYFLLKYMPLQAFLTVFLAMFFNFLFVEVSDVNTKFYTILGVFNYHVVIDDGLLVRPNGFFYEPGVFQFYLNLFLYLSLFVYNNKINVLFAVVAVLLTKSTTGIVILVLILLFYIIRYYLSNGSIYCRLLKFVFSLFIFSLILIHAMGNIDNKINGDSRGSFLARQYDALTGFNVIVENPFLGVGFNHENYYTAAKNLGHKGSVYDDGERTFKRNNTNGIIILFYSIGIPLALLFLVGLFRQKLLYDKLLGLLIVFISLLSQSLVFTPFFLLFFFSGLIFNVGNLTKERRAL